MILAVIVWICTLVTCQCRVIIVNNNGGYNSIDCCRYGLCPCSNFSDVLEHLENNTIVNITSQLIALEYHVELGSKTLNNVLGAAKLDNIIILGNDSIVMCNYKGSIACFSCSNILFEGIIWDRCAYSKFTHGIAFVNATNVTLSMCTFQHSNTSIASAFVWSSGFITVIMCQFLFNHVGNVSDFPDYAALFISAYGDEYQDNLAHNISVLIAETFFHHNGIFYPSKQKYTTINVQLFHQHEMHFYMDNSTVSANGGLGGNIVLANSSDILMWLRNCKFMNNNNGGLQIIILNSQPVRNYVEINSSTFAHNNNGSLKLIIVTLTLPMASGYSLVLLNNLTVYGNKGIFSENFVLDGKSISQGTGILLQLWSSIVYVNIS